MCDEEEKTLQKANAGLISALKQGWTLGHWGRTGGHDGVRVSR